LCLIYFSGICKKKCLQIATSSIVLKNEIKILPSALKQNLEHL